MQDYKIKCKRYHLLNLKFLLDFLLVLCFLTYFQLSLLDLLERQHLEWLKKLEDKLELNQEFWKELNNLTTKNVLEYLQNHPLNR